MTDKSYICQLISENENWEEILKEKKVNVRYSEDNSLAIFEYDIDADFSDDIVREARGIIIYMDSAEVACWPFTKFGNWNEAYADKINWRTARVEEKYDGSLIKLWFNKLTNKWQFSTNGTIYAEKCNCTSRTTFMDLIKSTIDYKTIVDLFDTFEKNRTYMFELITPTNKVVINYPYSGMIFIGERDNITGEEYVPREEEFVAKKSFREEGKLSVPVLTRVRDGKNLDNLLFMMEEKDNEAPIGYGMVESEGFVVVDKDFHRIKCKYSQYLLFHRLANNGQLSMDDCIDIILGNSDVSEAKFINQLPQFEVGYFYYKYKILELERKVKEFMEVAVRLYLEYGLNRKLMASKMHELPFARFGFLAIDYYERKEKYNVRDILSRRNYKGYKDFIRKYEEWSGADDFRWNIYKSDN